jgi:catechol 2,3-dioxygenase
MVDPGDGGSTAERGWLPESLRVEKVTLRVHAIAHQTDFYSEALGLDPTREGDRVELDAGGETLVELHGEPAAPERAADAGGLYHVAIRLPDRAALGDALARLRRAGCRLHGAADHVASEALYLQDPEGNGIELYADRPRESWEYTEDGQVRLPGDPLDLSPVEAAAPADQGAAIHPDADVGHVHLEVTDLAVSSDFYRSTLGFARRLQKPWATFLAGGSYHHHVALNTRRGRTSPYRPESRGLASIEFGVPASALERTRDRLAERDWEVGETGSCLAVADPDGIPLRFRPLKDT